VTWNVLSDVTSQALAAALRGTAARHAALASNIANVDTPGYARADVSFEPALAAAIEYARREPGQPTDLISASMPRAQRDRLARTRADGNSVDIDREMTALARNTLAQRAAAEMLAARIRLLRAAIHGGRT
jgi:flagellar basal-body rod protein FlgB